MSSYNLRKNAVRHFLCESAPYPHCLPLSLCLVLFFSLICYILFKIFHFLATWDPQAVERFPRQARPRRDRGEEARRGQARSSRG